MVLPRLFLFSKRRFHVVPVRKCSPKTFLIYVIIRENFAKFSLPRSGCFPPKSFAFRLCNRPSSPPLLGRASSQGEAAKRLTIFAACLLENLVSLCNRPSSPPLLGRASPKGKPMKEANFNLSSLGAARHSPQKGKARREGDLRYNFTLFQGGENIGKHFVFALSAVHYDEAFFVFPRLL